MSTDVTVDVRVARPRPVVAAYAMDYRNDPTWINALENVELLTDEPLRVGSRVVRVASFLGKRIEYVNEVVELVPDLRLVMRSVKAPFPMTVEYAFEDEGSETRVRIHAEGDASGFYRIAGPLLARAVRRAIAGDLARLKEVLEAGAPQGR